MSEKQKNPEEERKEAWLQDLSNFIVEANQNTWASSGSEVEPERAGYQELEYTRGIWRLRDSYTGYFRAPGMTTVYYQDKPSWTMSYGGHGQTEGYEDQVDETFSFLRRALMQVSADLPIRGPREYVEGKQKYGSDIYNVGDGHKRYEFEMVDGDLLDGVWAERITEDGEKTFSQNGTVGIVIDRDSSGKPVYPWNR